MFFSGNRGLAKEVPFAYLRVTGAKTHISSVFPYKMNFMLIKSSQTSAKLKKRSPFKEQNA